MTFHVVPRQVTRIKELLLTGLAFKLQSLSMLAFHMVSETGESAKGYLALVATVSPGRQGLGKLLQAVSSLLVIVQSSRGVELFVAGPAFELNPLVVLLYRVKRESPER